MVLISIDKKVILSTIFLFIVCIIMSSCTNEAFEDEISVSRSPNGRYKATIVYYSLGAAAPGGEKVYLENADGSNKTEIVYVYGYNNTIQWLDDNSIKITMVREFNRSAYAIHHIADQWPGVRLNYEIIHSDF